MSGRKELQCKIYPFGTLPDLLFVVICSLYQGRWLLSRHRLRDTWEHQGGHIEPGESPLQAAQRELYEESGVTDADLFPVCDYLGYNDTGSSNGAVFLAQVHSLGTLPESEIKEARLFDILPENLTYPNVTPVLIQLAREQAERSAASVPLRRTPIDQEGANSMPITLRFYRSEDCPTLAQLFHDTVHTVNARDYTPAQLDAWATGRVDLEAWDRSFLAHRTLIAEMDGVIAGFADMDDGYLDRLYVHHACQGQGVATALCDALEAGFSVVTTHASITARPFFERRGYTVLRAQQVERHGVLLTNYVMEKRLFSGETS